MRSALVLALVACGSSPAPAPTTTTTLAPPPMDAAPDPACPASYATASGRCSSYSQWCTYPEGDCACSYDVPEHCGGARLPPVKPGTPTVWTCTPKPPDVRADGCPGADPHGQPCSDDGKECRYEGCCTRLDTCQAGHWQETEKECPP
jgi:hypothetical protein